MIDLKACPLWLYRLLPFLRWWPNVTQQTFKSDALAALTGAMIVLPQAVAFATIAGLPPEYGLYAAMVPAIVGAMWGSSWHLVSGPTTAISIVVFASISPLAEPGSAQFIGMVLTLTLLARAIGFIDLSGAELFAKEAIRRRKMGGGLYIVGVQPDLCEMMKRSGQVDTVGEDPIFRHKGDAIQAIYARMDNEICRTCTARVFRECHAALPDGTPRSD